MDRAADLRWDLLLVCIAGYMLTAVGRFHQLFPVLDALRPAILTTVLALLLSFANQAGLRRVRHLALPPTMWLIALFLWMVLSVPGALVVGNSFEIVFDNFGKTALMYVVVAGAVRGPRDVERLAAVYLSAAAIYAAVVVLRFAPGAGDDWRLGRLYYYDANDFATFAVTALPFGLYFLHASRRATGRFLAAASLAVLALAFVRTGSRGGFIALVAVVGFVVLRYHAIPLGRRAAATALIAFVVLATASDQYWTQMSTILSDADYNRTEESGRLQIWRRGVGYMLQHPVFGVGPGNFHTAEGTLSPFADRQQFGIGVRWYAPHNIFVQVGAELGIVGLAIFAGLIGSTFALLRRWGRSARSAAHREPHVRPLGQALTAALIGFVAGAFFLSLAYSEMLYTLIALVAGAGKLAVSEGRR